jgi:hypothetical protein
MPFRGFAGDELCASEHAGSLREPLQITVPARTFRSFTLEQRLGLRQDQSKEAALAPGDVADRRDRARR